MSLGKFKIEVRRLIYEQHWTLGFIEQPVSDIIVGNPYEIHYVKGMPRDRWFADPFILDYDDNQIQVLVEEFCYNFRRGRIAKLFIERHSYRLLDYKIILDLPTHLSFPFILRQQGKIFICPENSESNSWDMYEYHPENDELVKVRRMSDKPLTDAILTDCFGEELIFATHIPNQNGNTLSIYSIDGTLKQNIEFPSKIARNAGDWFFVDGKTYRPAQDCNGSYGRAVAIQEVNRNSMGTLTFTDVCRITSTHPKFTTGCHTFNSYRNLIVIDVHGYRRPRLSKFVDFLRGKA